MQASAICLMASRIAKGGAGMVSIAGQWLNLVLEDLKLNKNLKVNRVTQSITVQPAIYGPFALEADYLRTYDLFYPLPVAGGGTASSMTQFLTPVTMAQFDAEFKSPSISNYPYEFATDLSTQAPWFEYTEYLITATAANMMGVTGDDRFAQYRQMAQDMLRPHLIMEGDEQEAVHSVDLDPRRFKFKRGLKPTKASPL